MIHALRYTEELEKVGFSTEQAKKSVQVWMDLMDQNFATKADFKEHYFMTKSDQMELRYELKQQADELKHELKHETKQQIDELKYDFIELRHDFTELRHDFIKLESKLIIKLGIMMAASVGIVSTIVALAN